MLKCTMVTVLVVLLGTSMSVQLQALLQEKYTEQQNQSIQKALTRRIEKEIYEERKGRCNETQDDISFIRRTVTLREDLATLLTLHTGDIVPHDLLTKYFIQSVDLVLIKKIFEHCDKDDFLLLVNTPFIIDIPFHYEMTKLHYAILHGQEDMVHIILDQASAFGVATFISVVMTRFSNSTAFDRAARGKNVKIFNDFIDHAVALGEKAFFTMIQSNKSMTLLDDLYRNNRQRFTVLSNKAATFGTDATIRFRSLLSPRTSMCLVS